LYTVVGTCAEGIAVGAGVELTFAVVEDDVGVVFKSHTVDGVAVEALAMTTGVVFARADLAAKVLAIGAGEGVLLMVSVVVICARGRRMVSEGRSNSPNRMFGHR
jgi:hypothetical protein